MALAAGAAPSCTTMIRGTDRQVRPPGTVGTEGRSSPCHASAGSVAEESKETNADLFRDVESRASQEPDCGSQWLYSANTTREVVPEAVREDTIEDIGSDVIPEASSGVIRDVLGRGSKTREVVRPGPRKGSGLRCSLGAALAILAAAYTIHYYIHAGAASATSLATSLSRSMRLKGIAGPFDLELEKADMCDKEKQGIGAVKMEWGVVSKDKDVPKRYHISGRGSFNYNTSDDLAAKVLLASWVYPGRWLTYYSNTFSGGCSMARNFAPEKWRRVSMLVFGHENADCPFPPIKVEVTNFTVENRQSLLKEFIYGRWKVESQLIDVAAANRVVSCGRAIFRIIPKKNKLMPAVVPAFDNSDKLSVELVDPPDAPP